MRDSTQDRDIRPVQTVAEETVLSGSTSPSAPGNPIVVIGGSGSGKSVLLKKAILGCWATEYGSSRIDGEESVNISAQVLPRTGDGQFGNAVPGPACFTACASGENVPRLIRGGRAGGGGKTAWRGPSRQGPGCASGGSAWMVQVERAYPSNSSGGSKSAWRWPAPSRGEPEIIFFRRADHGPRSNNATSHNNLIVKSCAILAPPGRLDYP